MPVPPSALDAARAEACGIKRNPAAPKGYAVYIIPTDDGDAFVTLPEATISPDVWQTVELLSHQLRHRARITLVRG